MRGYVAAARRWHRSLGAICLAAPTEVCVRRNRSRGRNSVPEAPIRNLALQLVQPTAAEGFAEVLLLRSTSKKA